MRGSRRVRRRENHPMVSGRCSCTYFNHFLNEISISRSAETHTMSKRFVSREERQKINATG